MKLDLAEQSNAESVGIGSRASRSSHAKPGYLLTLSWFPRSSVGGVNQAVLNLARILSEKGEWNPYLLVTADTPLPDTYAHIACPVECIYLRTPDLPEERPLRSLLAFLFSWPRTMKRLLSLLKSNRIQIVGCNFPETDCVHFALLRWLNIYKGKLILSFHGEDIRILARKKAFGRAVARWMMRHSDAVVACSRGLMQDLVAFEPACAGHARVIYNAIDIDTFRARIDQTFQLPAALHGRRFLLNVARYEHKKGHDILIQAFEKLTAEFPELMLVTIGESVRDEGANVRAMVEKSPAKENILMLENVPHPKVGVFLKAATLFVLASRREGFPFVLLEAGAMQTPVVAAACLGVPEIIKDGISGTLTPMEDPQALADAIADLLRNDGKRARLAASLNRLVGQEFGWDAAYKKHIGFDGSLTGDARTGRSM